MTTGRVSFVGAGPGAADLITLRGARRIAEADVVVWAPSVVDAECVREHARAEAELVDFSRVPHEEVVELYRRAAASRLKVVRLHAGDPALWGGVQDQYDSCQRLGLEVEIVPGVAPLSAAAAVIGRELTGSEIAQSIILTAPDSVEQVREFAEHGTTMAVSLPGARAGHFVEKLRAGGYAGETPVVVAYKVSQPDELIVHTTVAELENTVKKHKLYRAALFIVGRTLKATQSRARREVPDEPIRSARPTSWSRRAATRIAARVEEPPNPAWTAVEGIQQAARKAPAKEEFKAEEPQKDTVTTEPVAKPKLTVVAAAKKTNSVQASTTPKKKPAPRKNTKRTNTN
ncbi:cobalt-precorrin-4 C(11)-methyltransferase [Lentzea tibetensis]|uniref:Cobalt-precorrin-4 C(11)-methyltransferase n=1 Tax=Lentzea tibetensis TaxID=2591470 RepID=A0A563EGB1_9PSEU|nr:cobalt-precorrin-4/precorrin-4 C(11)-methyltransferase [Lentzea tibetensis]TWP44974.1 cobalt-precorrin-4 C(11)-methyltransferase [Lentzea tibetensis]